MPCFGYEKKLIVVKNSGLFKKETKKRGVSNLKETRDALEKYLKENAEDVRQNVVLVFIEDGIEKLNITKLIESIGGIVCEFPYQKPMQIEKRLNAICKAYKVNAENRSNKMFSRNFWNEYARTDKWDKKTNRVCSEKVEQ